VEPAGNGELGTGVVMTPDVFKEATEVEEHFVAIGTTRTAQPVVHWAGAGWTRSGDFESADEWNEYLEQWSRRLAAPLVVTVRP
jgi:pectinesterase